MRFIYALQVPSRLPLAQFDDGAKHTATTTRGTVEETRHVGCGDGGAIEISQAGQWEVSAFDDLLYHDEPPKR